MKQLTTLTTDQPLREQARIIYLSDPDITVMDVALMLNVPFEEVKRYVYGGDGSGKSHDCWYQLKLNMTDAAILAVMCDQKDVVEHTGKIALDIVQKTLVRIHADAGDKSKPPMSVGELTQVATIFEKLDKMVRLDNGKATDIRVTKTLSADQKRKIDKIMDNDPFSVKTFEVTKVDEKGDPI